MVEDVTYLETKEESLEIRNEFVSLSVHCVVNRKTYIII